MEKKIIIILEIRNLLKNVTIKRVLIYNIYQKLKNLMMKKLSLMLKEMEIAYIALYLYILQEKKININY